AVLWRRLGPALVAQVVLGVAGRLHLRAAGSRQVAALREARCLFVILVQILAAGQVGIVAQELLKLLRRHLHLLQDVLVHLLLEFLQLHHAGARLLRLLILLRQLLAAAAAAVALRLGAAVAGVVAACLLAVLGTARTLVLLVRLVTL